MVLYITHLQTIYDLLIRHYFRRILKESRTRVDPNLFREGQKMANAINARKT